MAAFQRNFVADVKQCDDMERDLGQIEAQVEAAGLPTTVVSTPMSVHMSPSMLQQTLQENAKDLRELKESKAQLVANYNHLIELSHVLQEGWLPPLPACETTTPRRPFFTLLAYSHPNPHRTSRRCVAEV